MNKTKYFILDYYNKAVIKRIIEKYELPEQDAAKKFLTSETHFILENEENGLFELSEKAIFDMWECEQITGDPRTSVYIRGE